MNSKLEYDILDVISRNYLKAERCEEIAKELRKCKKVKLKITKTHRCLCDSIDITNTVKNFDSELLANAFEKMSNEYKESSLKLAKTISKESE